MLFRRLRSWLAVADYQEQKDLGTIKIVARFSRGNTSIQAGRILDEAKLRDLSARGDAAMSQLRRAVPL